MNRWICMRAAIFENRAYRPGETVLCDQQPNHHFEANGEVKPPVPSKPVGQMTKSEINTFYNLGLNKKDLKATKKPKLVKMASK